MMLRLGSTLNHTPEGKGRYEGRSEEHHSQTTLENLKVSHLLKSEGALNEGYFDIIVKFDLSAAHPEREKIETSSLSSTVGKIWPPEKGKISHHY